MQADRIAGTLDDAQGRQPLGVAVGVGALEGEAVADVAVGQALGAKVSANEAWGNTREKRLEMCGGACRQLT